MSGTYGSVDLEPTLMIIGLGHRSAPIAIRERFWINEAGTTTALAELAFAEGIEEVVLLAMADRTEFLLWASDASLAANSVLRFLSARYGLKLCEWKHFYRLMDNAALLHFFRVISGLDSMAVSEANIATQVRTAWLRAQAAGTSRSSLDAVLQKGLSVSERIWRETTIGKPAVPVASAAVEAVKHAIPASARKKVVFLGTSATGELVAQALTDHTSCALHVVLNIRELNANVAGTLRGESVPFERRRECLADADIIIGATLFPALALDRTDAEFLVQQRSRPVVVIDLGMPRCVDPGVREVPGILLYDLDDLARVAAPVACRNEGASEPVQQIVEEEAHGFLRFLRDERVAPTVLALRERLDEICRQELECFKDECGPFTKDQEEVLGLAAYRITHRIAGSLARELKDFPGRTEQEQMTAAIRRLFRLNAAELATASVIPQ